MTEVEQRQFETLRATYKLFGQGDLMKFFLFEKHRWTSKWVHYFSIYEKWFSPYRGKDIVFVEVGISNGGSLQMWKNYFGKDIKIIGIDIDPRCKELEETGGGIFVEIGSQSDRNFWAAFKEKYPRVDILLDDGGHMMNQQIVTFQEMFPHIKDGGLYMCEDCHTSYWDFVGGGLRREGTYIEFTKNLIDEINAPTSRGAVQSTYNTVNIGGIHFYESIVVVEKNRRLLAPFSLDIGEPAFE